MSAQGPPQPYKITGVQTGKTTQGTWPPRKEFDEFLKDKKQAVLFFLALGRICQRSLDNTLSYFQLGGIHGLPRLPWPRRATNAGNGSYCVHGDPTFVTWHRVYLLAYEQAMHDAIMELMNDSNSVIPKTPEWKLAADTWRLPYWDFALRRSYNSNMACVPEAAMIDGDPLDATARSQSDLGFTLKSITDNPLYAYRYPLPPGQNLSQYGIVNTGGLPLTIQQRTVRHAPRYTGDPQTTKIWTEGISNVNSLKSTFSSRTFNWRADLVSLLRNTTTFSQFVMGNTPGVFVPDLNNIHGSVHIATGGGSSNGNMAQVPCAGFDPIFFIYHAGIDRLAYMWQCGHPDTPNNWLTTAQDNVPLVPFRNADGAFFTSKDVRSLDKWGYSYTVPTAITNYDSLVKVAFQLYGDVGGGGSRGPVEGVPSFPLLTPDYVFSCSFPSNAIGPFVLRAYVEVEGKRHEVGEIVNFVAPLDAKCDNCNDHRDAGHTLISSTYITPELKRLSEQGHVPSFDKEVLEPFLAERLGWSLYSLEDTDKELDIPGTVPSMKIAVTRRDKELREGFEDPEDGVGRGPDEGGFVPPTKVVDVVPVRGITTGKPGGLGEGEDLSL